MGKRGDNQRRGRRGTVDKGRPGVEEDDSGAEGRGGGVEGREGRKFVAKNMYRGG